MKQTDGSICSVIAFLHLYFLQGKRKYRMSLVENLKDIRTWLASKLLLDHCNNMTVTGFRETSVQKIFVEYDLREGEIKYDIMCPGNCSTVILDVYEKVSHLLKSSESIGENSRDLNNVEEVKGEFKLLSFLFKILIAF